MARRWRRIERDRQAQRERDAHRAEVRKREDAAHERRRAEAKAKHDAERRERAEAAAAEKRAAVERDLRLAGCPEGDVKRRADEAMAAYFAEQARATVTEGAKSERELAAYFRIRPAPSF